MKAELVVVRQPSICNLLSLRDDVEQVGIQHLSSKASAESLHKLILVGLARLDVSCSIPWTRPIPERPGRLVQGVVQPYRFWCAKHLHQLLHGKKQHCTVNGHGTLDAPIVSVGLLCQFPPKETDVSFYCQEQLDHLPTKSTTDPAKVWDKDTHWWFTQNCCTTAKNIQRLPINPYSVELYV